jgi:phosphoglycerate kinase
MLTLDNITVSHKRVLVREDFNVPIHNGVITDDARLLAALPTLQYLLQQNAAVAIISHLGQPKEGAFDSAFSLAPIADYLSQALGQPVIFRPEGLEGLELKPGQIALCENVRFTVGEKNNDPVLAKKMAAWCEVFVMDAFASAHRSQTSTVGVAEFAPIACAGPLLHAEIQALNAAFIAPKAPLLAIIGGAKVSSKFKLLDHLSQKVDKLIIGGGMANTFLAAQGLPVGASLCEPDLIPDAKALLATRHNILLPIDVVVATECNPSVSTQVKLVRDVAASDKILDIGPQTIAAYEKEISQANTILWNGPVGVFEVAPFAAGTQAIALAVAKSAAYSLAGGGDTLAAIHQFKCAAGISYISTGGGALLEFLQGDTLPAIAMLEKRAQASTGVIQ